MNKSLCVKIISALFVIAIASHICVKTTGYALHAVDTEVRNELALKQMENIEDSSALYEEYRNASNDANSLPIVIITIAIASVSIVIIFLDEIKRIIKRSEDTPDV